MQHLIALIVFRLRCSNNLLHVSLDFGTSNDGIVVGHI